MVRKYIKKPIIIEAIQYNGKNIEEVRDFIESDVRIIYTKDFKKIEIPTLEGNMQAIPSDFIIRGVNKEYYPCKEEIFNKTYQIVEENV